MLGCGLGWNNCRNYCNRVYRAWGRPFLPVHFQIVTIILAGVLPTFPVQSIRRKGVCSYPAHLFIDVLAKVSYVKNATSIIQVRINQVFPEAFEQR